MADAIELSWLWSPDANRSIEKPRQFRWLPLNSYALT